MNTETGRLLISGGTGALLHYLIDMRVNDPNSKDYVMDITRVLVVGFSGGVLGGAVYSGLFPSGGYLGLIAAGFAGTFLYDYALFNF